VYIHVESFNLGETVGVTIRTERTRGRDGTEHGGIEINSQLARGNKSWPAKRKFELDGCAGRHGFIGHADRHRRFGRVGCVGRRGFIGDA
jgi:hypothetical protein